MKQCSYIILILSVTTVISCSSDKPIPENPTTKLVTPTSVPLNCKNNSYPEDAPKFGNNSDFSYSTLKQNLKIIDIIKGDGEEVIPDDKVIVHYTGWLKDGCVFDSSYILEKPASFRIGRQKFIKGWDEGIPGMKIGGTRRLEIGPELAYGAEGISGIVPENATLIFVVELIDIKRLVQK